MSVGSTPATPTPNNKGALIRPCGASSGSHTPTTFDSTAPASDSPAALPLPSLSLCYPQPPLSSLHTRAIPKIADHACSLGVYRTEPAEIDNEDPSEDFALMDWLVPDAETESPSNDTSSFDNLTLFDNFGMMEAPIACTESKDLTYQNPFPLVLFGPDFAEANARGGAGDSLIRAGPSLVSWQKSSATAKETYTASALSDPLWPALQRYITESFDTQNDASVWNLTLDLDLWEVTEDRNTVDSSCNRLFEREMVHNGAKGPPLNERCAALFEKSITHDVLPFGLCDRGVVDTAVLMDGNLQTLEPLVDPANSDTLLDIDQAVSWALQWTGESASPFSTPLLSPRAQTPNSLSGDSSDSPTIMSELSDTESSQADCRENCDPSKNVMSAPSNDRARVNVKHASQAILTKLQSTREESLSDDSGLPMPDDVLKLNPNPQTGLFTCPFPYCTTSQARRYNLKIHYMTHFGAKSLVYTCNECGRGFRRRFDMRRHRLSRHGVPLEESANAEERATESASFPGGTSLSATKRARDWDTELHRPHKKKHLRRTVEPS